MLPRNRRAHGHAARAWPKGVATKRYFQNSLLPARSRPVAGAGKFSAPHFYSPQPLLSLSSAAIAAESGVAACGGRSSSPGKLTISVRLDVCAVAALRRICWRRCIGRWHSRRRPAIFNRGTFAGAFNGALSPARLPSIVCHFSPHGTLARRLALVTARRICHSDGTQWFGPLTQKQVHGRSSIGHSQSSPCWRLY